MANIKALNKEQLEAIEYNGGPLLIIAGAGTGKTTVITERIKYLILKKNIPTSEILALTFTEHASREMEERVDIAMPYGYTQMWISTFHGFCDRILRSEAIHIGLSPSYKLLTEAEAVLFLRKNLFKFNLDYFRPLGNPDKFLQGMLQHFSRLRDEDIDPSQCLQYAQEISNKKKLDANEDEIKKTLELAQAFKTYQELKVKEGVMDFSDLISNTLKLFRTRKNILKNYQDQFRYILVDEFQDTNFAQNELAILLAGNKKNITVVGDDDQAIYRWRGAAISNVIQFKKRFTNAKVITLIKNYRSTEEILDKAYTFIQYNNPDRLEVKENVNKRLTSVRKVKGNKIEFLFADRVENEGELVVKKIKKLIVNENLNYKDVAILVRANDHSQAFVRALERSNIPYQFLGPGRLFHQEEIKDIIAYLKVLYNFEDSSSLYRAINMPIFGFEARDIAAILNFAKRKNLSLFEALENIQQTFLSTETKQKINGFVQMIKNHLKRVPRDTAGQIVYYFVKDSGLLKQFIAAKNPNDEKKSQNIARFFDRLKTYETERTDSSVFAVVDWIDLSLQMGESPLATNIDWVENDAVNILTIHSSKGLEFKAVFLVNLVDQRFPTRERNEQIPIPQALIKEILPVGDYHLKEERRLFYVGMTRARDFLFLTAAKFYGEGKRERKISPFIFETLGKKDVLQELENQNAKKPIVQLSLLEWAKPKEAQTIRENQQPITHPIGFLSYSQIQSFNICPLHYKLRYILKIPTTPSSAQSFGISIHSTLRDFYQKFIRGESGNIEDYSIILEKNWINEGYKSREHEKEAQNRAKRIITGYLKNNFDKDNLPVALELPFNFLIKNLKIGGRIDRIDTISNNKIEILDYKTGNTLPDEKYLKSDLQLTIYALAATEVVVKPLNRDPGDVTLSLYFLEQNKKLTTTRSSEQLEQAKKELLKKAEEISKSNFLCSGSTFCQICEYKMLCSVG